MLVEITGSCGHTKPRDVKNRRNPDKEPTTRQVNSDVKFWSTQNCTDCYFSEISEKLAGFGLLAELVGSEKQVSWANQIRRNQLVKQKEYIETLWSYIPGLAETQPEELAGAISNVEKFEKRAKLLASVTDAKFWIDTRDEDAQILVGIDYSRDHQVKFDLETNEVVLAKRAQTFWVRGHDRVGEEIGVKVGGKLFHDRLVKAGS